MEKEILFEDLVERANEKIELGHELITQLEEYRQINGVDKIQRKISQEVKFLLKVIKNETLKINHVQCSNLTHYAFLVEILKVQRDVVHLDCGFTVDGRSNPLRVDIVCENGLKWIKAIARNSKSLTDAAKGAASYGARSILDQAQEFVDASMQHLCMFKPPKVVFYFSQNIDNALIVELQEIGVEIASIAEPFECDESADITNVSTLNIDITTLLAYISNVCNGNCNWIFREGILTEQAEKERQAPLKPVLDNLFKDKRLICCETAYKSFEEIISLLAGPLEHQRAKELMQRVEVLPDVVEVPEELSVIKFSGKINQRSLKIFAFGMHMKAVTVTSNKAFIRSAKMQGILTEQAEKERQAPLKPVLDNLFKDKRLICCETAYKSFEEIISLLAGPLEHQRAKELMQRVEVLPDVVEVPEELSVIKFSGKINQRSLKIFAFGMHMKAVTVTSNKAFIRSAKMQGINVPVFTHQARALTEAKEASGTPIQ